MNKQEFVDILTEYKDEYTKSGIDEWSEMIGRIENNNISSLNSDLSSIFMKLFLITKFENSKPYKMIDYILNNDNNYLKSQIDKDNFEEIKKTVYNKSSDSKGSSHTVFKSLFEYFKANFTNSYLFKMLDSCNKVIEETHIPGLQMQGEDKNFYYFEKKDKFTYQNYLSEKLKNNYNNNIMDELNDTEMWKSLIYICNKTLKNPGKNNNFVKIDSKAENEFSGLVKSNLDFVLSKDNLLQHKNENMLKLPIVKSLNKRIFEHKVFRKYMAKKIKKIFPFEQYKSNEGTDTKKVLSKLLDLYNKEKEDDYDRILKKFEKFETKNDGSEASIHDANSLWVLFKFLFHLNLLNKKQGLYITDEKFWKFLQDYLQENSTIIHHINKNKSVLKRKLEKEKKEEVLNKTPEKLEKKKEQEIPKKAAEINLIVNSPTEEEKVDSGFKSLEDEFNKMILSKLNNKENIFEIVKPSSKKKYAKRTRKQKVEVNQPSSVSHSEKLSQCKEEEEIIKPKTLRVKPGFNPTSSKNIIINNYYNIFNQTINNVNDPSETLALVENIKQILPITESNNNFLIQFNKASEEKNEPSLSRKKKGRPKKTDD